MNKLSSCELFDLVNKSFNNSIVTTIQLISENIDKYTVEAEYYEFMVKAMRSYKYPLSKLIVSSVLSKEIKPILLLDPKNQKDRQIFLPAAITAISTANGSNGYVDLSPRCKYVRNSQGAVDAIKIKEIELYTYLQICFIDTYLKRHAMAVDKSGVVTKNVATAYSRLFSRCIDRTYPVSATPEKFNVSIFLSAVFSLVTFFGNTIEDAKNIVFSSGLCKKNEIESDCRVLREDKLVFDNLSSFLNVYSYEFSDYIKEGTLTLRAMVNMYTKMYGANSYFAIEHCATFMNMIMCIPIGLYNDKFISKTIKDQVDKITASLLTTFASK